MLRLQTRPHRARQGANALVTSLRPANETLNLSKSGLCPGLFAQIEVPQVLAVDGRWYLLFCTPDWSQRRAAHTSTYYVVGANPRGPFTTEPERVTLTASGETHMPAKLHRLGDQLVYLATVLRNERGAFVGDLSDPQPVTVAHGGRLIIDEQSPASPPA